MCSFLAFRLFPVSSERNSEAKCDFLYQAEKTSREISYTRMLRNERVTCVLNESACFSFFVYLTHAHLTPSAVFEEGFSQNTQEQQDNWK
jgi:hypothetical protein